MPQLSRPPLQSPLYDPPRQRTLILGLTEWFTGWIKQPMNQDWQRWFTDVTKFLAPNPLTLIDNTGVRDTSGAFNQAISDLVRAGYGGDLLVPQGNFRLDNPIVFPAEAKNIRIIGSGPGTKFLRGGEMPDGQGMFDVRGASDIQFQDFSVDGQVTNPVGLQYTDFAFNPAHVLLTKNSSFWVHGGSKRVRWTRVQITHTGGYARIIDPYSGLIEDITLEDCHDENNRPHLFGTNPADLNYGSWTGGTYVNGDGADPAEHRILRRFRVRGCTFRRGTGNQLWTHLFALNELHSEFIWEGNSFTDIGLDGLLVGGVSGGLVNGNIFRRIGYTTKTDSDTPLPRWLPNAQATAIDSSGLVKGVNYVSNSITSVNGGSLDLDGHGESVIANNVCRCPQPGEPEYDEDRIAESGPTNALSQMYGVNLGNSNDQPLGAQAVNIVSNQFLYLRAGAVRLFAARHCQCEANSIAAVDDPSNPPILIGNLGPGANKRTYQTFVRHNRISYSPAGAAPAIAEVDSAQGFQDFDPTDKNFVFGNNPIDGNGNAFEFQKAASSGSTVYGTTVWWP